MLLSRRHLLGNGFGLTWSEPRAVALTLERQMMRCVDQPVQGTLCEHRIGEERIPILGTAVRGHHQRLAASSPVDQLVGVLGLGNSEVLHGQIIEDQRVECPGRKVG